MDVVKDGKDLGLLQPEKRMYKASRQATSEGSSCAYAPNEDLVPELPAGMSDDNLRVVLQAYVNPLVSWVWIGGLTLIYRHADLPGSG